MVTAIYLLFESLSIIVCLFWLLGEKVKVNSRMICVIVIHMGLFIISDYVGYSSFFSLLMYTVITGYARIEFKRPLHETVIRVVVMILLCIGVQIVAAIFVDILSQGYIEVEWSNLITNLIVFFTIHRIYRKINIQSIVSYIRSVHREAKLLLLSVFSVACSYILYAKRNNGIDEINYLLFFVMALTIVFLVGVWEKYRIQIQEKKIEIEVHEIYADSYKKLIDEIRVRQHEFDNHLQAIINQRYTCHTYEELVEAQSEYIHVLSLDNRYNKLPQQGNYVYIGFLYGKLVSLEKQGINVDYKISIGSLESSMPVYKLIEITNDLLTNACEAVILPACISEPVCLRIDETKDQIILEVRNVGAPLNMDIMGEYFKKGYSRKGIGRGLGLYNVKKISEQYGALIECKNMMIDNRNWILFMIKIQKPTNS